ncbi:MAG: cupin domain-containing protein [Thermoguttaceae bacterium]|jgi:mannose-6-phosphate isomerase-like protein (cupin superfamily)
MSDTHKTPMSLIHRHSGDPARVQQLGPYAIESLIEPDEEAAGTAYRVTIGPRERTSVSYHRLAEEYYYVLSGSGTAILDGRPYPLAAGDFLRLPPGTSHGFIAADEPLEMLNVHTPGSRPDRDVYFLDGEVPDGFEKLSPG